MFNKLLRTALTAGEIVVFYQPQVATITGETVAVELLARWRHPQRGLLPPTEFLGQAGDDEEAVQLLSEYILRQACRDAAAWPTIGIGLNISPVQFRHRDFAARLISIARQEGFPLPRLELEILESAYFENPGHMGEVLGELRALGIRIALDDFGTGFSSLKALLDLPLDKLKIDSSFVSQFDSIRAASIIHAIVALARAQGLKITAEGVETQEQRAFLRAAGCHYLQGYLYSRALSADALTAYLAGFAPARAGSAQ